MNTITYLIIGISLLLFFKTRKVSARGLNFIKNYEKLSLKKYKDADKWSIGWGHLLLPGENYEVITRQFADQLLAKDLKIAETAVNDYVKVPLTTGQFDALVSLIYNIGITNFKKSTLLRLLNNGDYDASFNEFPKWNKARKNGVLLVNDGLIARRKAEQQIFMA